jgi:hypothetical protein
VASSQEVVVAVDHSVVLAAVVLAVAEAVMAGAGVLVLLA